jgi:hypothetical protein
MLLSAKWIGRRSNQLLIIKWYPVLNHTVLPSVKGNYKQSFRYIKLFLHLQTFQQSKNRRLCKYYPHLKLETTTNMKSSIITIAISASAALTALALPPRQIPDDITLTFYDIYGGAVTGSGVVTNDADYTYQVGQYKLLISLCTKSPLHFLASRLLTHTCIYVA